MHEGVERSYVDCQVHAGAQRKADRRFGIEGRDAPSVGYRERDQLARLVRARALGQVHRGLWEQSRFRLIRHDMSCKIARAAFETRADDVR